MGLNSEGGLFFVSYLDPKVQICKTDLVFEDLFASPDGSFVCGLSGPYLVFWDLDQNGPVDQGPLETHKFGPQVQKVQVGKGHCIILTVLVRSIFGPQSLQVDPWRPPPPSKG